MQPPETTTGSRQIFQGHVVTLRVDTIALPGGRTGTREVVEHSPSVTVLPVDDQGNVLLERQYRRPVGEWILEVPAGGMNEGETPEEAARRELLEETGYAASKLERLASFYMSPGFCTELMHAFLATGLTAGKATPEEDEFIQVEAVPLSRALEMVSSGEIRDAKTIAVLLLAEKRLNKAT
ncbi:MAG: NUDIX hydrolase [Chloroflexi bacterium]|nr:NUDIX hydrolase [Chloroflexota bacterium]